MNELEWRKKMDALVLKFYAASTAIALILIGCAYLFARNVK